MLKKRLLACAAASVAGLMMSSAANAITVQLSLQVDSGALTYTGGAGVDGTNTHSWAVYATIVGDGTSNTSITSGLNAFGFDVTETGSVALAGMGGYSGNFVPDVPNGVFDNTLVDAPNGASGSLAIGFNQALSTGTTGVGISAAQNSTSYKVKSASGTGSTVKSLLLNVGLAAGTDPFDFVQTSFGNPVLLAEGTFSVNPLLGGSISVSGPAGNFALLPNPLGANATVAGTIVTTIGVDNVGGATVAFPVPEPASLAVLGLGLAAFAARRRRKTA